ncbi:MAG: 4'-phosphopantetheinyl transferase superfamily protein [Chitinophagales bacterium]
MPVAFEQKIEDKHIMVWEITEPLSFFAQQIVLNKEESEAYHNIRFEKRKLEWMAARYVQRLLINDTTTKDQFGKPHLQNLKGYISISHCQNYAAAIFSAQKPVGIDIEPTNEKILRIADKYTSQNEFNFIDKNKEVEHLVSNWCIKEAVYKYYGKKELNFKENICIQPYLLSDQTCTVLFSKNEEKEELKIHFNKIKDIIISFL